MRQTVETAKANLIVRRFIKWIPFSGVDEERPHGRTIDDDRDGFSQREGASMRPVLYRDDGL
ncbi:hypothetical protein GCM10025867_19370 [Frondihabitans sucicola]|uniref:Uncharacterized protein n=1 Tax=Frondihabitans sucicola TaxID=1268041 RepID=A0ABN6Y148_9MICO|nr:hypothetical protein [Frondihabitans sucicola]BDZ49696.1 hypothetical protein GCM10025867_19370 [Frondihabitans sucicola]